MTTLHYKRFVIVATTLVLGLPYGCGSRTSAPVLLLPNNIKSIDVFLFDSSGVKEIDRFTIDDSVAINDIYGCLTPYKANGLAEKFMDSQLTLGKLIIHGEAVDQHIEFVAAGKNPLVFSLNGVSLLRHESNDINMRSHNNKFYNEDVDFLDESLAFFSKLQKYSKK